MTDIDYCDINYCYKKQVPMTASFLRVDQRQILTDIDYCDSN